MTGLLSGPWPVWVRGQAKDVHIAAADFQGEQHVDPLSVTAQSTWKKSTASMVEACVRKNCRHVVSVCRDGAGVSVAV
jgi:hypothetical protein